MSKDKCGNITSVRYAYADNETQAPAFTELYTNEYDNKNRLIKVTQGTTQLEKFDYDDLDRQTKHTFGANTHEVEYDDYGQVAKEIIKIPVTTLEYTYSYRDTAARTLSEMSVWSYTERYEQDAVGRMRTVTQKLAGKEYSKRYGYYKNGDHATNRLNTIYYGRDGVTDGKLTYTYDAMGNVISVNKDGKQIQKYAYDKLNRIIFEKYVEKDLDKGIDKSKEVRYTYDDQGNILTKEKDGAIISYRYEEGTDRLVAFGDETFAYDGMGNPTTYKGMTCAWEKGRQLKSITDEEGNTVTYTYDVNGLRTSKTIGDETTSYIYESGRLLRKELGSEVMMFLYGVEGVMGFMINGICYLYRKNLFGDVTEIYVESGQVVGRYSYTAFGECTVEIDEQGIATKNPIRYRGYCYDEETGLYYLKSRYYDPEIGRFITIDSISYLNAESINGLNLYAYCGNNPVMRTDATGKNWWSDFWSGARNWISGAWDYLKDNIFQPIGDFFTETIPNTFNNVVDWIKTSIIQPVSDFFTETIPNTFNNVVNWIKSSIIQPVGNFFTETIPNFFVDTFWNNWIVDKVWNRFMVGTIWNKGLVPAWNWLNGTSWYQIVVKNIVLTGISTGLGALIGSIFGPIGTVAGTIIGAVVGIVVGVLWDFGVSGINP